MSCYRPLHGFDIGECTPSGKVKYLIADYNTDRVIKRSNHWSQIHYGEPIGVGDYDQIVSDYVRIPCGKCVGCRLDYAKTWAERILAEKMYSTSCFFLTLTYNDDEIPRIVQNKDSVLVDSGYTLLKSDTQNFFKRVRKWLSDHGYDVKCRYFLAGEYGDRYKRPHYHAIVFNLPEEVLGLKYYKTVNGYHYFTSEWLNDRWKHGYVVVGECTVKSASYVARYCLKKMNQMIDWSSLYVDTGFTPEFVTMSRNPGIGLRWIESNYEKVLKNGYVPVSSSDGEITKICMNRYFKNKIEGYVDPSLFADWQELRKQIAIQSIQNELFDTDLDEVSYMLMKENQHKNKIKSLKREVF